MRTAGLHQGLVTSMSQLPDSLRGQGAIGLDLETCDPDLKTRGPGPHRGAYICGVSISTEAGLRAYIPIAHEIGPNLEPKKVLSWLGKQLKTSQPKIGARLIYDLAFLIQNGVPFTGPLWDVQVAEPLLDENKFVYSLESIAKQYLGEGKNSEEMDAWLVSKFGRKNPRSNIWRAPSEMVAKYAVPDSDQPIRIFQKQRAELEKQELWDLFLMESDLTELLARMFLRGVRVDLNHTEQMRDAYRIEQASLVKKIKWDTGIEVSVWAAASLAKVFDYHGIPYGLTAKTKKPSFTAAWLEAQENPIGQEIRRIRWLDKMCGTFLEGSILEKHHEGRIHTQFNQLKSDEGGTIARFSSKQPNLQFIPTRTAEGKKVRSAFLPDQGQDWYKLDYSQIEYRLIVHDANCAGLRGAAEVVQRYHDDPDVDFHEIVAEMVFGTDWTKDDRQSAKTINFGLAYGEGVVKLAAQLGLTIPQAERLLKTYHSKAPFIKPLAQAFMGMASQKAEIRTLMNRKRRFNLWAKTQKNGTTIVLPHRFPGSRRAFTHKALNARIQGSAADIMKLSMVDVWKSGVIDVLGVPQLTIHDELDGSVPRTRAGKEAVREMKRIMEKTLELTVPLLVDMEIGKNWGATTTVEA